MELLGKTVKDVYDAAASLFVCCVKGVYLLSEAVACLLFVLGLDYKRPLRKAEKTRTTISAIVKVLFIL